MLALQALCAFDALGDEFRSQLGRFLMDEQVLSDLGIDSPPPEVRLCQGTLLSRAQFLVDLERFGYEDARHDPGVHMTDAHIAQWTDAIAEELRTYGCTARDHTPGRSR